jgi:putative endonuclease
MASRSRVLYTGITNDLARRVNEHKQGLTAGFTRQYRVTRLVYFEEFTDIRDAIAREKEVKGWKRSRKIRLIERRNPTWEDLAERLFPFSPNPSSQKRSLPCHPERSARQRA